MPRLSCGRLADRSQASLEKLLALEEMSSQVRRAINRVEETRIPARTAFFWGGDLFDFTLRTAGALLS
ncbi:hypothetical protein AS149_13590 [Burkholderia cenocepacia]|nr:hypothetical protein AS149_13590 [Burkholderia cenocepacia]